MDKQKLLVIAGPTASGKTRLGVRLAQTFDGEVVSADSMQIYRGMEIATAVPDLSERQGVPHHLLSVLDPVRETCSVLQYVEMAKTIIADIHQRGRLPIVVGGTGLYISALIDGTSLLDIPWDDGLRRSLSLWAKTVSPQEAHQRLAACDPELAAHLHPNDQRRILRALEVFILSGIPMSVWQEKARSIPPPYDHLLLGLTFQDRQKLYRRIDLRVDDMLRRGLLGEARHMLPLCTGTAAQAIGHKELAPHILHNAPLPLCVDKLKQATRRYAKRQLTWFNARSDIHWFYYTTDGQNNDTCDRKVKNTVHKWLKL